MKKIYGTLIVMSVMVMWWPPVAWAIVVAPRICDLVGVVENIIRIVLGLGGISAFVMFVVGAVQWLTAGVNDQKLAAARSTITWAIMGVALLMASFFILVLIEQFTGIPLQTFKIPWIGAGTSPCG